MNKSYELDGLKINNIDEFHLEISKLLEFPDYYGKNLDLGLKNEYHKII